MPFYDVNTGDTQQINLKIATCQFVPNFLSYISVKHWLNCFTVGKVITEIKGTVYVFYVCKLSECQKWRLQA